ncbi:hypothetical protein [Rhodococcus rhodochrous]|uniref:hypothetical protein n=1 Tax=Rhodococcus rhodochrous TaxID=1829 RepID=UPI00128FC594|nr:hypothetical protein [Rhodococcus rhodochrous]
MREPVVGTGETGGRAERRCGRLPDGSRCHAGVWFGAAVAASAPSAVATGSLMVAAVAGAVVFVCVALATILI